MRSAVALPAELFPPALELAPRTKLPQTHIRRGCDLGRYLHPHQAILNWTGGEEAKAPLCNTHTRRGALNKSPLLLLATATSRSICGSVFQRGFGEKHLGGKTEENEGGHRSCRTLPLKGHAAAYRMSYRAFIFPTCAVNICSATSSEGG